MILEIALILLSASVPVTSLLLKFSGCVSMVDFVRLETLFFEFKKATDKSLKSISRKLEIEDE